MFDKNQLRKKALEIAMKESPLDFEKKGESESGMISFMITPEEKEMILLKRKEESGEASEEEMPMGEEA